MLDKTCMAWLEYFPVPIQTPNYVIVLYARIKRISALRTRAKVLDFIIFISNYIHFKFKRQSLEEQIDSNSKASALIEIKEEDAAILMLC